MEYYDLCLKIIEKELKKFNLDAIAHSEFESGLTALFPEDFDVPYNRCAFMSCYATSNILSFKDCITNFLLDNPKAQDLIGEWKSHCEVKVCSLSTGPGLDYFAFMLSILEYDALPPKFNGAKVVSKYSSWQYTIDIMSDIFQEQGSVCGIPMAKLNFDNVKVVKTDDLVKCFSKMYEHGPLRDAHIILMMKTLSLSLSGLPQEMSILHMLKEMLSSLRSDATIFCLDTTPSAELFNQALSCFPGKFLYGPVQHNYTIPVIHSEVHGSPPGIRSDRTFFVWRKLPFSFGTDPFSFEITTAKTESLMEEEKVSDILPWRELPNGKIQWGAIFWENASLITKKSLNSLMTLKEESLEHHWIGEVARLYLKEYGNTEQISTSTLKKITENNLDESSLEAKLVVAEATEVLSNAQTLLISQNVNILKDVLDDSSKYIFTDNSKLQLIKEGREKAVENVVSSACGVTETSKVPTNNETLPIPQGMDSQKGIIDTNTDNSLFEEVSTSFSLLKDDKVEEKPARINTLHKMLTSMYSKNKCVQTKATEMHTIPQTILSQNTHSPEGIFDISKENILPEENCLNAMPTSYFLDTMNNFNCKSIQGDLAIHTNVCVPDSKKEMALPIAFLEENITRTKNIHEKFNETQIEVETIKTESNKKAELTAVVNNKITEKPQFEGQLFQTGVQGSLQRKNNLATTQIRDVKPPCLKSCPKVKKQKEKLKYSEILPWKDLTPGKIPWGAIFWQNASLATKKSLKSVLSFKKEIRERHWIGEVARLYIKEFGMPNLSTSTPNKLIDKNISHKSAVESIHLSTEASDILNIPQTVLTPQNVRTPDRQLDTDTTLYQKDNAFDITPNTSFHIAASNFNCKSTQHDFTVSSLETEKIPLLHVEENLADLSNLNKMVNDFKTQVEPPNLQTEVVKRSEPAVIVNNNTNKSLKTNLSTTVVQDSNQMKTSLASIKALTKRVEQLLTSFDRLTNQNNPNEEANFHTSHNSSQVHQNRNASHNSPNTCGKDNTISSGHSMAGHASASRDRSSSQNVYIPNKCPHLYNSFNCRRQCCHNLQNNMPLHSCSMHCHRACNAARCNFSFREQPTCSVNRSYVNFTSQNLVIPVQNISEDALLKIMSILKNS